MSNAMEDNGAATESQADEAQRWRESVGCTPQALRNALKTLMDSAEKARAGSRRIGSLEAQAAS